MSTRHLQLPLASTSSSVWGSIANTRQQAEGLGIRAPEKFVGYGGVRGSSSGVGVRDSGKSYRGRGRGSSRGGSSSSGGGRGYSREGGDSRGYRGGRGSWRGGGRRGGRYDALRRAAEERMHPGAYKVVDEETGEDVVVWGVEDEELPRPTAEDLKWKPAAIVAAGDVSEEGWYKAMEASMAGPSGAFSVRGVRQGGTKYPAASSDGQPGSASLDFNRGIYPDDDEEDPDYDDEDEMYKSDDDEEEEDDLLDDLSNNSLEEPQDAKPVRPARVKLFGRDFKQNDFLKVEVNATQHSAIDSRSGLFLDGDTSDVENQEVGLNMMSSPVVEKESIRPNSGDAVDHLMTGTPPKVAPHQSASFSYNGVGIKDQIITSKYDKVCSPSIEEAADQPWPPVGALLSGSTGDLFSIKSKESKEESSSESNSAAEEGENVSTVSRPWPPQGMFSGDISESRGKSTALGETKRIPGVGEFSLNVKNSGQKSNNSAKDDAHISNRSNQHLEDGGRNVSVIDRDDDVDDHTMKKWRAPAVMRNEQYTTKSGVIVEEREERSRQAWLQGGGMNPGILEIDVDGEFGVERVQDRRPHETALETTPVRSNLLDELRMQTQRKLRTQVEEDDKFTKVGDFNQESGSRRSLDSVNADKPEGDSSGVTVVRPRGFRDLAARTNFDPSLAAEFFSQKSFVNVGASEEIIRALASLQVKKPSAIQAMAFKPVMEGRSCIVADQTGSGKTLAYVAPLVQMLRVEEAKSDVKSLSKKPRVLVLVPTSELAVQVHNVCRAFSKGGAPFRSIVLTGGFKWKTQAESLAQGADVVIATPGRFLQHLEKGSLKLDMLRSVVLDEVDILLDDQEFAEVLQAVDEAASKRVQYVHVTATLPVDIHDSLLTRYPDAIPLMGPTLHQTAVGLQEILVDCSGAEGEEKTPEAAFTSKKSALLQLVDQRPVLKTIIFCNKIEVCRRVENALARHDRSGTKFTVLPYHAALSQEARLESMQQFLESTPNKSLFLVCTDRASRGLDSFDVEHVVLFDYPRDPSEYVRRVGRTARGAGGTGKVFVFALGKQVAMARRIMARNEKGRPIHDVPGSEYEM